MWLLENLDDAFQGRRLWLRPGKLYLFGRTVAEPGQVAILDKTISRKHLTIQVEKVAEGGGRSLHGRSKVTIEDQKTKLGTLVNGEQIRSTQYVVTQDDNTLKMGSCPKLFRLFWHPVVLSFSFTSKELRADPWAKLREELEQLDIKFLADYDIKHTSHVVSKKRNTPKGLQALINGKYIVTDTFITAIAAAAASDSNEKSALELDFDGNWPDALQHLPPRGEEPSDRPIGTYAPDARRLEVFDGYTFVFYEKKQYENLFAAITNGKGKALIMEAIPNETSLDDFIRYVKSVAGEKGLGSFEDGSEGRGVVVVRYAPSKGDNFDWFVQFTNSVSLRLDHRLIEQSDFLDAILACEASMLRRPLQEASQPEPADADITTNMDVDPADDRQEEAPPPAPAPRATRSRPAAVSRFKGFDDDDEEEEAAEAPQASARSAVSNSINATDTGSRRSQRKRPGSPLLQASTTEDLMNEIAPTSTAVKRRRIAGGADPLPPRPASPLNEVDDEMVSGSPATKTKGRGGKQASKKVTVKKEDELDILEMARRQREEAEARATAEAAAPDEGEVDWAAVRRLQIVEECTVRQPAPPPAQRTRDQDIADGRWDPQWNGRRNFKKFRRQGEPAGRPVARVIVGLEEVKTKAYGIGDDYWVDDDNAEKERRRQGKQKERGSQSQSNNNMSPEASSARPAAKGKGKAKASASATVVPDDSFSSDMDDDDEAGGFDDTRATHDSSHVAEPEPSRTRAGKAAERANVKRAATQSQIQATQTQAQTQTRSTRATQKRASAASPSNARTAKRPRREAVEIGDSGGESDDGDVKFRFGRR